MNLSPHRQDVHAARVLLACVSESMLDGDGPPTPLVRRVIHDHEFRYQLWLLAAARTHPFYGGDRHLFALAQGAKHRLDLQTSLRTASPAPKRVRASHSGRKAARMPMTST